MKDTVCQSEDQVADPSNNNVDVEAKAQLLL